MADPEPLSDEELVIARKYRPRDPEVRHIDSRLLSTIDARTAERDALRVRVDTLEARHTAALALLDEAKPAGLTPNILLAKVVAELRGLLTGEEAPPTEGSTT